MLWLVVLHSVHLVKFKKMKSYMVYGPGYEECITKVRKCSALVNFEQRFTEILKLVCICNLALFKMGIEGYNCKEVVSIVPQNAAIHSLLVTGTLYWFCIIELEGNYKPWQVQTTDMGTSKFVIWLSSMIYVIEGSNIISSICIVLQKCNDP